LFVAFRRFPPPIARFRGRLPVSLVSARVLLIFFLAHVFARILLISLLIFLVIWGGRARTPSTASTRSSQRSVRFCALSTHFFAHFLLTSALFAHFPLILAHFWLTLLITADTDVPVPKMLLFCDDPEILGVSSFSCLKSRENQRQGTVRYRGQL
jgi:hypothetical protein